MSDSTFLSAEQDPMRMSRAWVVRLTAAISAIVLVSIALMLPVPYVYLKPGDAFNTLGDYGDQPMFTFGDDVKTYPTTGDLDFTTVAVLRPDGELNLGQAIVQYLNPDVALVPRSLVYPDGTTAEGSEAESTAQFDSSKDSSRVAALRAAGYTVPGTPKVAEVASDGAAADVLEDGDLIRSVDGKAVDSSAAAVEAVSARVPGQTVSLDITRGKTDRTVQVTTKADRTDPTIPRIGITLGTSFDFPIEVTNNVDAVGGPSAGMMFALGIYDKLTPGALTGGLQVAGTGEITPDGVVGPIGGVQQKIAGAAIADATVFLVPAPNCAEALDGDTKGLKLVKIETLDGAINALTKLANNPKATVPSCS